MQIIGFYSTKSGKMLDKDSITKEIKDKANKALGIVASATTVGGLELGSKNLVTNLETKLLGPSLPAAGRMPGGAGMYDIFRDAVMPYMYDLGNSIVLITFAFAAYQVIRKEQKQGLDRIKWCAFGTIVLHAVDPFLLLVTNIATKMSSGLSHGIGG